MKHIMEKKIKISQSDFIRKVNESGKKMYEDLKSQGGTLPFSECKSEIRREMLRKYEITSTNNLNT